MDYIIAFILIGVALSFTKYLIDRFLWGWPVGYIILIFLIYAIYDLFVKDYLKRKREKEEKKRIEEAKREREKWLKNIEPIQRNISGRPSVDDWIIRRSEVCSQAGGKCEACGTKVGSFGKAFHVHHIIPVSQGGNHSFENLELLCKSCHTKRHRDIGAVERIKKRGSKKWRTAKHARREWDCEICGGLIEEGEQYFGGNSYKICTQCYESPE